MKTFQSIQEERGERAFKQAMSMGLKYGGFGYWKDPQTNETVYKTENDVLVKVEPREESELAAKGGPDDGAGRPDAMGGGMAAAGGGGGMAGAGGMLQMPGAGMAGAGIQGAPMPGEEKVAKDRSWEPGPDGDTCVGPEAEEPGKVPEDSFVGRTNFLKWRAGPDGDNMNTVSLSMVKEQIREAQESSSDSGTWGMETDYSSGMGRNLSDIQRGALASVKRKDKNVVGEMNNQVKSMVQQPDYKMDQFDEDESGPHYVAGGAFGKTFRDKNGNIVKKGRIGPGEMGALHRMKDNKAFPNLINAQFDSPFIHESSAYNNPLNQNQHARDSREADYWDPDYQEDFHRQFPTAFGTYAMSAAKGKPLSGVWGNLDEETRDKATRSFWRARGDLHKAGFSHNDMHGGNIMIDPETGEASIIDLGLAKEHKLSALMEGLGGLDFEEGNDRQLARQVSGSNLSDRMQRLSVDNRANIEDLLVDNLDLDPDSDEFHEAYMNIQDILRGDIRMKDMDFDRIKEQIPYLADDENVDGLIKMLYDGVGNSELADRMGDAFERKQLDTKTLKAANLMRKQKGQSEITPRTGVIPPKNMDFDD
jgi:hypothetical protein